MSELTEPSSTNQTATPLSSSSMQSPGSDKPAEKQTGFRWHWGFTPIVAIGIAMIANFVLIMNAKDLNLASVRDNAYEYSASYDQFREARAQFERLGLSLNLASSMDGDQAVAICRLGGLNNEQVISDVSLEWYRPSDASLDRTIQWPLNEGKLNPLQLALPKQGIWKVTINAKVDGTAVKQTTSWNYRHP